MLDQENLNSGNFFILSYLEQREYFLKRVSPQLPLYVGGGGIRTTYLELLSSNLVCKPNLGATFDF